MALIQTAIIPEPSPFAQFAQLKIYANHAKVLAEVQKLPEIVHELNHEQPNAKISIAIGFTHSFWTLLNQNMPDELEAFKPLGQGETHAVATDVDLMIHIHSMRPDLHFYILRKLMLTIQEDAKIVDETATFRYLDSRDMTGFIDGTENPTGDEREEVAIINQGEFTGGSYLMLQRFVHQLPAWERLSIAMQEKVIGRTKEDSVELENVPAASHVGRVDIKENGKGLKIVRHSLPYGTVSGEHGLLFASYSRRLYNIKTMLESMYGETDGKTDQLLRFTKAVTGAYFFVPSITMLEQLKLKDS